MRISHKQSSTALIDLNIRLLEWIAKLNNPWLEAKGYMERRLEADVPSPPPPMGEGGAHVRVAHISLKHASPEGEGFLPSPEGTLTITVRDAAIARRPSQLLTLRQVPRRSCAGDVATPVCRLDSAGRASGADANNNRAARSKSLSHMEPCRVTPSCSTATGMT